MNIKISVLLLSMNVCFTCYSQNVNNYTENEVKGITALNSFIDYLNVHIKNKADISDSATLKYILVNYLFVDKKIDTSDLTHFKPNELTQDQFNNLKRDISTFYNFLQEKEDKTIAENVIIIPLRLSRDTFIYNRLTAFQKRNTLGFYDKRFPKRTLGYIILMPEIKNLISKEKIWSWTLIYKFGKFFFKSAIGEEGHEYLFER